MGQVQRTVLLSALVAGSLRLVGLLRPVRGDEAGFTLVARAWDPSADSLFGPYFVDRPPLLVATYGLTDWLAGPLAVRVLGALACVALVLLAAATAHLVAGASAARWTSLLVAALCVTPMIDIVATKGELLGLPLVMGGALLGLLALRRGPGPRGLLLAGAAGAASMTALGYKQNLVGGLVFGATLLVVAVLTREVTLRRGAGLGAAALAGSSVPVLATVGWAVAAGVRLEVLGYAVWGFRGDASVVLASQPSSAPAQRAVLLVLIAAGAGMIAVIGGLLVHVRDEVGRDAPVTWAVLAMLAADAAALVASGSYWRDYLLVLVPSTALAAALLVRRRSKRGRAMRAVVGATAVSSAISLVVWGVVQVLDLQELDETDTGAALAAAAEPGDTLTVFGGRADLQLTSGMDSPYPYLWSLPMRTLDPDLARLRALVSSPQRPTWLVEWVYFGAWTPGPGAVLRDLVEQEYVEVGGACGDHRVYLRRDVERPAPQPRCHG
ncbi:hypothetical protein I601_0335 [Nocardioides dokdonensis FR1436]|uniref:Glycosyltransferase RgtA/B/C/D-like domain-containing protein n=1 Tax=Nocardioides dokdonensis FR1436 TaxID=1300347 RepID=A0A1A9GEU2_9ACTN|nr:hypothetical protein [Nocardioides dokdonensis]ANH36788.1 hypothetical protein I601_0335 [Nocardioides dokdonensis FR1436]